MYQELQLPMLYCSRIIGVFQMVYFFVVHTSISHDHLSSMATTIIKPHYMARKSEASIPQMQIQPFVTLGTSDRPKAFLVPPNAEDYRAMPNFGMSYHTADELKRAQARIWKMSEEELSSYADYVTRGSHFTVWYQKMFSLELLTRPDANITAVGNIMFVKLNGLFDSINRIAALKADSWREAYHAKYLPRCDGCLLDCGGQRNHMGVGGCLETLQDDCDDEEEEEEEEEVFLMGMAGRAHSAGRDIQPRKKQKWESSSEAGGFPASWYQSLR